MTFYSGKKHITLLQTGVKKFIWNIRDLKGKLLKEGEGCNEYYVRQDIKEELQRLKC